MEHNTYKELQQIVAKLFADGKGLLAVDESPTSIGKRFEPLGIENEEKNRKAYRTLLITTPELSSLISGVIFQDETFRQKIKGRKSFAEYCAKEGIVPGIKVDKGLAELPGFEGEKITLGLDGLPERMAEYKTLGAGFAKWRAVFTVDKNTPSGEAVLANAMQLAHYAVFCQAAGIVPIVEPEVLYDGAHTIEECEAAMTSVYKLLFKVLTQFKVYLPGMILKSSMVLPGKMIASTATSQQVADATVRVLTSTVPKEVGGIVFLSGGQGTFEATQHLNDIMKQGPFPWPLTYSYSRAVQDPVLAHWAAHQDEVEVAQKILAHRFSMNAAALHGTYESSLETVAGAEDEVASQGQD